MDATNKKLVRRARLRRSHDRHVRTARMRKKADDRRKSTSREKSSSTVPSLPSLQGSQYLTGKTARDSERQNSIRLPQRFQSEDYVPDSCIPLLKEVYSSDMEDRGHCSDAVLNVTLTNTGVSQKHAKKKPRHAPPEPPLPASPISPSSLCLVMKEKTESLKLTDKQLSDIKQMSSHLRIINWLCDAHRIGTVGNGGGTTSWKFSPTSSGNLVVVRQNSHNWFDVPQVHPHERMSPGNLVVVRQNSHNWFDMPQVHPHERMSPVSVNSDLRSDFEEELLRLV